MVAAFLGGMRRSPNKQAVISWSTLFPEVTIGTVDNATMRLFSCIHWTSNLYVPILTQIPAWNECPCLLSTCLQYIGHAALPICSHPILVTAFAKSDRTLTNGNERHSYAHLNIQITNRKELRTHTRIHSTRRVIAIIYIQNRGTFRDASAGARPVA